MSSYQWSPVLGSSSSSSVTGIGALDGGTLSANGASISGHDLFLQSASASFPGLVTLAAQTFAGAKTFSSAPILSSLTASLPLKLDGSKNITAAAIDLSGAEATGILAAGRFPALTGDITTSSGSLVTTLASTISGAKVFSTSVSTPSLLLTGSISGALTLNAANTTVSYAIKFPSGQGGSNTFLKNDGSGNLSWSAGTGASGVDSVGTIDSQTKSADALVISGTTIYAQTADDTYPGMVSVAAQTFAGAKTFSTAPILSSLTASLPLKLDGSKNITAAAINLSGSEATGTLAAGRFPALTGDVTTVAGALASTLASTISGGKTFSTSVTSPIFSSSTASPAASGTLRLASGNSIAWRDNGDANDILLAKNASDALTWSGTAFLSSSTVLLAAAFPALTGDITTSAGALTTTLATVNANTGPFGSTTAIPSFTVNGKGLITAASTNAVVAPAGTLTGTTLASGVVTSSLTTVGTIGTGVWSGTAIAIAKGGTGQATQTAAFDALSPMSALGDVVYGGASGTGTRLAGNTAATKKYLTQTGNGSVSAAPVWAAPGAPLVTQLTSGTAATFTPTGSPIMIRVRMVGGGGGGQGTGTGGVTTGGTTPTDTTFGALTAGAGSNTGAGGTSSGGSVANFRGGAGARCQTNVGEAGAIGGLSMFGGNGQGGSNAPGTGGAALANSGSGGGTGGAGAANTGTAVAGGAGGYVEHIYTTIAANYTYTVGVAGTGGTAGTSGAAGGAGGTGLIIVEEHYA